MSLDRFTELATKWREDAAKLREYGCDELAAACERHAEDLEAEARRYRTEELTVAQAAEESGYTPEYLRELVRQGKLEDARPEGFEGPIRIRRCDLDGSWKKETPAENPADDLHQALNT